MSLSLTLDAAVQVLDEPGFYQLITTRQLTETGYPEDAAAFQSLWFDEGTRTLMLRPLQLDSSWLCNANQLDSVLRLGTDLLVNAADLTNQKVFEQPVKGNADDPFIYHTPVGPAAAFGGTSPSPAGVSKPFSANDSEPIVQSATVVFKPDDTMPAGPVVIDAVGGPSDGRFIGESLNRQPANAALFFRWYHPHFDGAYPCIYEFYVAQYKLRIKDVVIEIFRDTSAGGDRSSWKKVAVAPLFSVKDFSYVSQTGAMPLLPPQTQDSHDRSLLWLPFRQNQILLYASTGKSFVLTVNANPVRLADDSDWDITRSDTVLVWVLTPAPGRFQIQRVKYPSFVVSAKVPPITVDYTPSSTPTVEVKADTDHGTSIFPTLSSPPNYTIPTNDADDCPPDLTLSGGKDVRAKYGIDLAFTASSDQRWTPFFYSCSLSSPRTFTTYGGAPVTVTDQVAGGSPIQHATLSAGLEAGEGRLTVEVVDLDPFPLAVKSGHSGYPVQLKNGADVWFNGIVQSPEAIPLVGDTTAAHRLVFSARDRWDLLSWGLMRDRRDWTGVGHIDAVRAAAEEGGIDTSTAEFPAGYTAGVLSTLNTPLGLADSTIAQKTREIVPGWAPRDDDTPATFIRRIVEVFSQWWVGFRLDGTFFYLPRDYFTTPSLTFTDRQNDGSGNPVYYDSVSFTSEEPEANVILVKCADAKTGSVRYSSVWTDWGSILNPSAVNYIGRAKRQVVLIGGSYNCAQLNWIARSVWNWTRRRRFIVTFEADFVPTLKIGQLFTLGTQGNYRLIQMQARLEQASAHRATYKAWFDELGYGT